MCVCLCVCAIIIENVDTKIGKKMDREASIANPAIGTKYERGHRLINSAVSRKHFSKKKFVRKWARKSKASIAKLAS